jgi:hypothetical protein
MNQQGKWYRLKAKDGRQEQWGCKVFHKGQRGEQIEVTNSRNEMTVVTLGKRVAEFDDAELWTVE